jgi:putative transcription antitermination factor YqgF
MKEKSMIYLGIDLGLSKSGIAIGSGGFAEPLVVIKQKDQKKLIAKMQRLIDDYEVSELVVGVSEGEMGKRQEQFAEKLAKSTGLRVHMEDETLSTYEKEP